MILDSLKATWILVSFALAFLWYPTRIFAPRQNRPLALRIGGNGARMALAATIVVVLLTTLKALTAITLIFLFVLGLMVAWLRSHGWAFRKTMQGLQGTVLHLLRSVEAQSFGSRLLSIRSRASDTPSPWRQHSRRWAQFLERRELPVACFVVVLLMTCALRSSVALRELRFDQPEQYGSLLHAREALLNLNPGGRPFVFPALIATTSLISGVDPMQVTRFLAPIIGIFFVVAAGLLVRACTRSAAAGLAAMYCLGASAFPPARHDAVVATSVTQKLYGIFWASSPAATRASTELELGLAFLLLGLALLVDLYRNSGSDSLLDLACCVLLVGIISPFLLLILVIASTALLFRPALTLPALFLSCYGLAAYSTLTVGDAFTNQAFNILPLAAALAVGGLIGLMATVLRHGTGANAEAVLLIACLVVAVVWLPPNQPFEEPLEYEAAARKTEEIAFEFPRQKWLVAAPVEQLSETFGYGGYEDLAGFVDKYRNRVSAPEFRFQDAPQDLFIYVEKTPFQIFPQEPSSVSFGVLMDSTYRSYRSPAGRASLESAALEMCENYREHHSDADVYFEDDNLRIYHIHRQTPLSAEDKN
jgi:hypothetical protein